VGRRASAALVVLRDLGGQSNERLDGSFADGGAFGPTVRSENCDCATGVG
jgi:hypothetical protein